MPSIVVTLDVTNVLKSSSVTLEHFENKYCTSVTEPRGTYEGPSWASTLSYRATAVKILPSFAAVKPTSTNNWFAMYYLETLDGIEYLDTSEVTDMYGMFSDAQQLTTIDVSRFDTRNVTNMGYMFSSCINTTQIIGIENFDTGNVTNMGGLFYGCNSLESLDVSRWNTAHSVRMIEMFAGCHKIPSLDLRGWDTSNVTTTGAMFSSCIALDEILGIEDLDLASNTYFSYMFAGCESLTSLDLSGWDTSSGMASNNMFDNCTALTGLNVSGWDFSSVDSGTSYYADFYRMFADCTSLGSLDLNSWSTSTVKNVSQMFNGCTGLQAVFIGDGWDMSNVTDSDSMFYNCNAIVGQDGTTYDETNIDVSVAHADEGGYLRSETPFDVYTLATVLSLDEDVEYHVGNALRVVKITDDKQHAFVTDKAGTWARLDMDATGLTEGDALVSTVATLDNGTTAPALRSVTATVTGDIIDVTGLIASIDLAEGFEMPVANAVVNVTGWYFDGILRGWSDNKGQSLTLATDYADNTAFEDGKKYTVTVAVELKEPWSGAPRRARSSYDYDFQNLIGQVITVDAVIETGVSDLNVDTTDNDVTYDLQGRQVRDTSQPGIYIRNGKKFIVR
mgnify:CR=1 FL=1